MLNKIPDLTKIVFAYSQYFRYMLTATAITCLLFVIYSLKIWRLHKRFGGYGHCKKLTKKARTRIDGPVKLTVKTALMASIALLLGLTMLGPRIKESQTENEYEPAQVIVALDCTISMLAEDVRPSRIIAAKTVINNLLERLKQEGNKDKVGFLRFADIGIPAIIIPTKDYDLVESELRLTTSGYLKIFENQGTDIWDAITQGLDLFDYSDALSSSKNQEKILLVISDGEQVAESKYIDETRQEAINKRNSDPYFSAVKIFIVGIGNKTEPALIPKKKDENGNTIEFYAQTLGPEKGKLIQTSPDPAYLEETAGTINGKFIRAASTEELDKNINDILNKERRVIGAKENIKLKDVSPLFIWATLILLFFVPIVRLD